MTRKGYPIRKMISLKVVIPTIKHHLEKHNQYAIDEAHSQRILELK